MDFPREARLVRRGDFDAVYRAGKRRSSSHFTVFFRANQLPVSRFGFSIKKALGGAVVRNRMKRRLREAVRLARVGQAGAVDVVINPKKSVLTLEFSVLLEEVGRALEVIAKKLVEK
jgi:ribonuclease P protein component